MLDKSSITGSATDSRDKRNDLITINWHAMRRDQQLRMNRFERAEYRRWVHNVAIFYVCVALVGIGWTIAHVHSDTIQHIAGGLRTALIGGR